MFEKEGRSDLAIVQLAYAVCTLLFLNCQCTITHDSFQVHEDPAYEMGIPLEPIKLGIEEPKPGDVAITAAHWGLNGTFSQYFGCFVGYSPASGIKSN